MLSKSRYKKYQSAIKKMTKRSLVFASFYSKNYGSSYGLSTLNQSRDCSQTLRVYFMSLIISSILIGQEWRDYNYDDITVISMHVVKSRIGGTFNNGQDYTETKFITIINV